MTTTYTYAKAVQDFDLVLKKAFQDGKVKIRKNNQLFILMPEVEESSALDVEGVDMNINVQDILSSIHESRRL